MGQALRATLTEGAAMHVRLRIVEPSASGPSKIERADAKCSKMRRVALREQRERHVDLLLGNGDVEVFARPS